MLVLTRKNMESIRIGPDIRITICRIEGSQVRVGIEAPIQVEIVREELINNKDAPSPDGYPERDGKRHKPKFNQKHNPPRR